MLHKIVAVYPLSDYIMLAGFEDGIYKVYDLNPLFEWREVFKTLKNNGLYFNAHIDKTGHGIVWNDEVDLSAEEIWNNGVIIELNSKSKEHKSGCRELSLEEVTQLFDTYLEVKNKRHI